MNAYKLAVIALFVLLTTFAMASPQQPDTSGPARIEFFSPQGTVKNVRQVQVRFSEPIVPFGHPREVEEPFEIDCSQTGTARWVDGQNWAFDFERDLPAGIECLFTLKDDLETVAERQG